MTQDITDEVLEMDESNTHSLTPRDQVPEATPSPTGYRDYKPPAEVLSGGYQRNIGFTKNISPRREFGRDIEDTAHKVFNESSKIFLLSQLLKIFIRFYVHVQKFSNVAIKQLTHEHGITLFFNY